MDYEETELLAKRLRQLEDRLERLEAQRAIGHVMYRYVHACDELKDATRISSLFTEDAVWEGQGHFAEFGKTVGREAIREMFVENPTVLPFTAHFLTNPVIGLSRDGRRGWGQWHTLEAATLRDGKAQVWIAAWYDNDFELVDDDWKIKHIRYKDSFVAPHEEGWLKVDYVSPISLTKITRV
jgi:hypothetical protein